MTKVEITVSHDGDPYEVKRRMEYEDGKDAVEDAQNIVDFIKNYA